MHRRVHHVAGPRELVAQLRLQLQQHFFVPVARESAARAVVGDSHAIERGVGVQQRNLVAQSAPPLVEVIGRLQRTEVDLVDDRQHRNLEQDRVQPRATNHDVDFAVRKRRRLDGDVLRVELKQSEKVDEVALDEAQAAQILQLRFAKSQRTKRLDLILDGLDVRHQIDARDCGN